MDRNRPIARIVPVVQAGARIRITPATRPFATLRNKRYPRTSIPVDSTALLREERGDR